MFSSVSIVIPAKNMAEKVAVVTGSNRGIGFVIVQELCRRGVGAVYLTARDPAQGQRALQLLADRGYNNARFIQLDVSDRNSVQNLALYLKAEHGGLDILINNAAVINKNYSEVDYEDAKRILDVNYFSLLTIQELVFPLLKDNARVINISSDAGHIGNITNEHWISRLTSDALTVDDVNAFVNWFLDEVKNNTLKKKDFYEMELLPYRISKVALSALTRVQQRTVGRGISVNSLHPGFIKTGMTCGGGHLPVEAAGAAPVYLALDLNQAVKGRYFWFDKTEKDWADPKLNIQCKFPIFKKALEEAGAL